MLRPLSHKEQLKRFLLLVEDALAGLPVYSGGLLDIVGADSETYAPAEDLDVDEEQVPFFFLGQNAYCTLERPSADPHPHARLEVRVDIEGLTASDHGLQRRDLFRLNGSGVPGF